MITTGSRITVLPGTYHLLTYLYINHVSNSNYIIVEGSYMIYNLGDGFENLSLILLPGIFRVRQ